MWTISVALDQIARRILETLVKGSLSTDLLAAEVVGGASRMVYPRLVWLEGLGMIEGTGAGTYSITALGAKFLEILS